MRSTPRSTSAPWGRRSGRSCRSSGRARPPTPATAPPVVALVAVGITLTQLDDLLVDEFTDIVVAAVVVLIVGIIGAWLIAHRLRRQTHGMGEREITRMYEYYSAVLHAVREGLLLIDLDGRVQLVNDEARRLLHLPDDVVGPLARRPRPAAGARRGGVRRARRRRGLRDRRPRPRRQLQRRLLGRQGGRRGGHPARPHRAAGRHRRARHRPRPHRVAAGADPRGRQPVAHRGLPHRDRAAPRRPSTSSPTSSRSPRC